VKRVVFLAVRGEETICFWSVSVDAGATVVRLPTRSAGKGIPREGQLALPIAVA
jgi:hypothetical protein